MVYLYSSIFKLGCSEELRRLAWIAVEKSRKLCAFLIDSRYNGVACWLRDAKYT